MTTAIDTQVAHSYWFVGAVYDGSDDQAPRFLKDGIWENGYEDRYLDLVKSVQVGDRIAIKSSYTRKHDLPFDNRGQPVSVMAIKAVGIVTENQRDGRRLRIRWTEQQVESPREWYFFTHRGAIWRVLPGEWKCDALIAFTFNRTPQNLAKFQNSPYWRERFGTSTMDKHRFQWTRFYEAMADKLLSFRHDRGRLVAAIHAIAGSVDALANLQDKFADGTKGPLKDICPFTAFGVFNRGIKDANRKIIAKKLAEFLEVKETVPETFEGIPVLTPIKTWFFGYEQDRQPDDIDALWGVFEAALKFAASDDLDARDAFIKAFDDATGRKEVAWNLTFGLYWIRPWVFAPLDKPSKKYLEKKLSIEIGLNGHKHLPNAADYLGLLDSLEIRFGEEGFPVHSYPEFSLAAWQFTGPDTKPKDPETDTPDDDADVENGATTTFIPPPP